MERSSAKTERRYKEQTYILQGYMPVYISFEFGGFLFSIYVDDLAKSFSSVFGSFIVLYADDILLLAPTLCQLQKLLSICRSYVHTNGASLA